MFTFVVLIITIIICLSHVVFGHFKYLSAHNYKVRNEPVWMFHSLTQKSHCPLTFSIGRHGWCGQWTGTSLVSTRQVCGKLSLAMLENVIL